MPQSEILNIAKNTIEESLIFSFARDKVDPKERLNYQSEIISILQKPIAFFNNLLDRIANLTLLTKISERVDYKTVVLFFFVITTFIFPGYGTANTSVAFLPGSPTVSFANQYGSLLNLVVFVLSICALVLTFVRDARKKAKLFSFSSFEIILLLFLISIELSTIFSSYINISLPWLIKVLRGVLIYFIFSRINLNKNHLLAICFAFLVSIYFESTLAIFQYFHGGFIGLSIESAKNVISPNQLYVTLNNITVFRPSGTLSQENVLSFWVIFSLPPALIFALNNKSLKLASLVSIFLCGIIAIITLSRWGIITFFFSLIAIASIIFVLKPVQINLKRAFRSSMIFLIIIIIAFIVKNDFLIRFSQLSSVDVSLIYRFQLISQALYVFQHNFLFGIGGGTFPQYLINYDFTPLRIADKFPAPVHNFFLLTLSELGILALVLVVFLILYITFSLIANKKILTNSKDKLNALFLTVMLTSLSVYLFNGLWTLKSLDEHLIVLLWMNLGIYINIIRSRT